MKKKFAALLLLAALCLSLCACGERPRELGRYNCTGYEYQGIEITDQSLSDSYVILSDFGRGSFSHGGEAGEISWFLGGEYLELTIGDKSYEGSIKNGVIELGISDELHVFFRWDQLPPLENQAVKSDYYGWWRVSEPQGEMPETWMDCFARIDFKSGQPELLIWDEDGSADKPMGRALLEEKNGLFSNLNGSFWYSPLEPGQWLLDFDAEEFPETLRLKGSALDRSGAEFQYDIFLRPWGRSWEDVEAKKPRLLPYYYNDWYLPLIEAEEPMPDSMEIK